MEAAPHLGLDFVLKIDSITVGGGGGGSAHVVSIAKDFVEHLPRVLVAVDY